MNNHFSLQHKTIFITGASSGIGKQACIECSAAGARIILNGRNEVKLKATFDLLPGNGHSIVCGDLSNAEFIEKVCQNLPQIDGLVHAAGIMKLLPLKFIKPSFIDEIFNTNLRAPILLVSTLTRLKKINPHSSIVLISSINGAVIGSLANSVYGASKGGLQAFCKSSSLELAKNNVRINCIAPGMVETAGVAKISSVVSAESIENDKKKYPISRYGQPQDISSACLFLLASSSTWMTGTTLIIDGGYTAQ